MQQCGLRTGLTDIIGIVPTEADLEIVILDNQLGEPTLEPVALIGSQSIDLLYMQADGVDAFPTRDRIRTYDRMRRSEIGANIRWSPSWDFEPSI